MLTVSDLRELLDELPDDAFISVLDPADESVCHSELIVPPGSDEMGCYVVILSSTGIEVAPDTGAEENEDD